MYFSVTTLVAAAECKLQLPINIGNLDLVDKGLVIRGAEFDVTPAFYDPALYVKETDKLELALFQISYGSHKTGYLGASVGVHGKLMSIGFSQTYVGNFNLSGGTEMSGGQKVYFVKKQDSYSEAPHTKGEANYELKVSVANGKITAVELIHPVFVINKKEGNKVSLSFTGKNQHLCLKKGF